MARRKTPSKRRLKARFRIGRPCAMMDLSDRLLWEHLKRYRMRVDYLGFMVISAVRPTLISPGISRGGDG